MPQEEEPVAEAAREAPQETPQVQYERRPEKGVLGNLSDRLLNILSGTTVQTGLRSSAVFKSQGNTVSGETAPPSWRMWSGLIFHWETERSSGRTSPFYA